MYFCPGHLSQILVPSDKEEKEEYCNDGDVSSDVYGGQDNGKDDDGAGILPHLVKNCGGPLRALTRLLMELFFTSSETNVEGKNKNNLEFELGLVCKVLFSTMILVFVVKPHLDKRSAQLVEAVCNWTGYF